MISRDIWPRLRARSPMERMDTTWLLDARSNQDGKIFSTRTGDAAAMARVLVCSITNDWRVCTYDHDWRSARREFRISRSVFEASTLLIDWGRVLFLTLLLNYNWAYRLARTLTIKLQPSLLSLCSSHVIYISLLAIYILASCVLINVELCRLRFDTEAR